MQIQALSHTNCHEWSSVVRTRLQSFALLDVFVGAKGVGGAFGAAERNVMVTLQHCASYVFSPQRASYRP